MRNEACEPGLQDNLVCLRTLIAEDLIPELAERSEFVETQVECNGDAADIGATKVPAGACKLWVRCILRSPDALRAADNGTLVLFLKATLFFQDQCMVKTLCGILAASLHDCAPTQADQAMSQQVQVSLGSLPVDVAMEVLRSMPGSFLSNFVRLPTSLRPMAALAEHAGLSDACVLPGEGTAVDRELPTLTMCHDTTAEHIPPESSCEHPISTRDMYKVPIWLTAVERTQDDDHLSVIALEERTGTASCRLVVKERRIEQLVVMLLETACIVFGPDSGNMHVKYSHFNGGSVVCMGSSCRVTFEYCCFSECSLVVCDGAQVAVTGTNFIAQYPSTHLLSVLATGADTRIIMKDSTITEGAYGMAVQDEASLQASNVNISYISNVGVYAIGVGTSLELTKCSIEERNFGDITTYMGMCIGGGAKGKLHRCSVQNANIGLHVCGPRSHVDAVQCEMKENESHGMFAVEYATINAVSCSSSNNGARDEMGSGYEVRGDATMELTGCRSEGDRIGCSATWDGKMVAYDCTVKRSQCCGFEVRSGSLAVLRDCSSITQVDWGIYVTDEGSQLDAERCYVENNLGGFCVEDHAVAAVRHCKSRNSVSWGYLVRGEHGQMTVSHSTSDGDQMGSWEGVESGNLVLDNMIVDGLHM